MKPVQIQAEQLNDLMQTLLAANTESERAVLEQYCQPLMNEAGRHQQADWAAHMTPALAPYSLLGQQFATLHNGNLLSPELYPALKQAELELLSWFCRKFGQAHAGFTHGSSYANLEALWHARDQGKAQSRLVYGSKATHYSVAKACQILGLAFREIPSDAHDRLLPEALEQACRQQAPLAVVLNAGTSAAGMLDPLDACITICQQFDSWIHIDAAWGGATMLLPEHSSHFESVSHADSISFDPHKAMMQPKPSGILLLRHARQALETAADYLLTPPEKTLIGSYGGELFLPLWLNMKLLGEEWFFQQIRLRLAQSRQFALKLSQVTDWPVYLSDTGIVCFEPSQPDLLLPLQQQGLFSTAKINDKAVYRAVFASAAPQADTLIRALRPFL